MISEESLFCRRFVEDVYRCAGDCAPAAVVEIERRVRRALSAPSETRERSWARLVAAVDQMLAGVPPFQTGAAARLRAFIRENDDLRRPHDVAITDFSFALHGAGVLGDRAGRRYLVFARPPRAPSFCRPGSTSR